MKIHSRIKERIKWLQDLYKEILQEVNDPEIAKVIYKRVVFEEGY